MTAPATAAPDEIPANTPQSSSRRRSHSIDSRGRTMNFRSRISGSKIGWYEAVVQRPQSLHELARRWLDRDDLHRRTLLLEEPPDAHQRPARAEPGHEHVDLGAVAPDLRPRALVVRERVRGVPVLEQQHERGIRRPRAARRGGSRRCCPPRRATRRPPRRRSRGAVVARRRRCRASRSAAGTPGASRRARARCRCCPTTARGSCRPAGARPRARRGRSSSARCGPSTTRPGCCPRAWRRCARRGSARAGGSRPAACRR